MIKLPVRARANRTPFGERRMACSHGTGATHRHRFVLDWRRDGMMRFALLVSRAFCHCSGRGGDGQGRCSGSDRRVRRSAADGPSGGIAERRRSTDLPGRPAVVQAPAPPITCWRYSAEGPRASDTSAGQCRLQARTCASSEAGSGGAPGSAKPLGSLPVPRRPSQLRGNRLFGAALPCPMRSAPLFRLWRSGTRCRKPCGSTADYAGRP